MLQHVSEFPSFLRVNNVPLCVWATFCLLIHPSVDTWIASTFWLLWIMLLWTWGYIQCLRIFFKNLNKWALKGNCWLADSLSMVKAGWMMQATGCNCSNWAKSPRSPGERGSLCRKDRWCIVNAHRHTLFSAPSTPVSRTCLKKLLQYAGLEFFFFFFQNPNPSFVLSLPLLHPGSQQEPP